MKALNESLIKQVEHVLESVDQTKNAKNQTDSLEEQPKTTLEP